MRFTLSYLMLCLTITSLTGCGGNDSSVIAANAGSSTQLTGRLTITGSSTVAPLVTEIAKRFESEHPDVRIDVQSGGSGKGVADTRGGVVDIGMVSRELADGESGLTAHPIAADGVCLIVNRTNSVTEISDPAVVGIYTDRINNWRDLGGPDCPITVVHKAEGRATLAVFLSHFRIDNPGVKPDVVVGDNEHGIKTVAGAVGAVGYVSIGTAVADSQAGVPIRLLPVGGIEASTDTVASGEFPLSRSLNLVTGRRPGPLAIKFVNYCQSQEVHDLVVEQYFVPIQR